DTAAIGGLVRIGTVVVPVVLVAAGSGGALYTAMLAVLGAATESEGTVTIGSGPRARAGSNVATASDTHTAATSANTSAAAARWVRSNAGWKPGTASQEATAVKMPTVSEAFS